MDINTIRKKLGRTFGLSNFDLYGTILVGWLYGKYMDKNVPYTIGKLFVFGEFVHWIMNIRTPITTSVNVFGE